MFPDWPAIAGIDGKVACVAGRPSGDIDLFRKMLINLFSAPGGV